MSSFPEIRFGDGDYIFALKLPQILELQRVCGAGIFTIYGRVVEGWYTRADGFEFGLPHEANAHVLDVYETIRLGLIGGGAGLVNGETVAVGPNRARELVETYAHPPVPLKEAWNVAVKVLVATIEGYDDQKKSPEPDAAGRQPKTSTKRKSSATA